MTARPLTTLSHDSVSKAWRSLGMARDETDPEAFFAEIGPHIDVLRALCAVFLAE